MTQYRSLLKTLLLVLAGTALACARTALRPTPWPTPSLAPSTVSLDCLPGSSLCLPLHIEGEQVSILPNGELSNFRGVADPNVRQDPLTGNLWLAYSRPHIEFLEPNTFVPGVDIQLAFSADGGATWSHSGTLWPAVPAVDPAGSGQPGFTDFEVANLLPVQSDGQLIWYGVRLAYFIPLQGHFAARPPNSFRILISAAPSPGALADAPFATLGSALTDPEWDVDVNLAALSPDTRTCMLWNEPALHYQAGELFLLLRCLAFDNRGRPEPAESDLVLYATRPQGDVKTWTWRYVGRLAGSAEAAELGGAGLTQGEFALAQDGQLLLLVSPDAWDDANQEFIHYGCRVVEIASLDPPALARDSSGQLVVRASITASDQQPFGPGSCGYDPASSTGILIARRFIEPGSMTSEIYQTGVSP